jgi:Ca2+/Na+ antiporter
MKLLTPKVNLFINKYPTFIINLILFLFIFIPIFISNKNFVSSFIIAILFTAFVAILVWISTSVGKKVHSKIFERKIFTELRQRGFQKENIDKYEGLIKTIEDRTVRVFYNWNKLAEGPLSFGDIEINIFYKPQLFENDINKIDIEKLKKLNKKYDKTFWSKTKRHRFSFDRLNVCFNYYPWTTSHKIDKEIYKALDILKENGLEYFNIHKIPSEYISLEKDGCFYPNMEYIWENFEKQEELPLIKIE